MKTENTCPKCNGVVLYMGFSKIECGTDGCSNFRQLRVSTQLQIESVVGDLENDLLLDSRCLDDSGVSIQDKDINEMTEKDIQNIIDNTECLHSLMGGIMGVFDINGYEYAIGTDNQADLEVKECIKRNLWTFNSSFLEQHIQALTSKQIDALRGDSCESCNEVIFALIDDFDDFVDDTVNHDGRANFLSMYDGEEKQIGKFFLYRT